MSSNKKFGKRLKYFIIFFLGIFFLFFIIYIMNILIINRAYNKIYNDKNQVALRKFPYPYKAAMSICSDIDGTRTIEEFLEIQKFLNTEEITQMGKGVGLEIGNSFLMYAPQTCSISYFSGDSDVSEAIIKFIKSGYIDFLHSYGQKIDFSREDAIKSINEFKKNHLKLDVWVDHFKTIDNLGDDCTLGLGDHPYSKAYHSDLTLEHGIKFFWLGRVTMIIGQSSPIKIGTFSNIFDSNHKINSFINISKEFSKNILAFLGNKKYAMHKKNDLVKISILDDGQKVYEFIRFDNYWKGVSKGGTCKGLAYVISKQTLNKLIKAEGYSIAYTHLGMNSDCSQWIPSGTQNALRNLAEEYKAGNIYVTTTSKLLNYYINHKYLNWSYEMKEDGIKISIQNVKDPIFGSFIPSIQDLQGITFYIPDKSKVRIFIDENEIENSQQNPPDYTGRKSITIPLVSLKYPLDIDFKQN